MTKRKIRIIKFDEIDSTNTYLRTLAEKGEDEGLVVTANYQSSGRGRCGKSFFSPADTGLYMSILVRPHFGIEESLFLTPMTAVAVARAIDSVCEIRSGIKWVNDIYINEKKVSGILCEGSFDHNSDKVNYVVVGIGVNLNKPHDGFPEGIANIATYLGNSDIKEALLHKITEEFFTLFDAFPSHAFLEEYKKRSIVIGRDIEIIGNETHTATVLDIDEKCHLVIRDENRNIKTLSSGEISTKIKNKHKEN